MCEIETKVCKHCGVEKPKSEYNKAGGGRWLQPYCKPCDKIRKRKHRDNNIYSIKKREHEKYIQNRKLVPQDVKEKNAIIRVNNLREAAKKYISSLVLITPEEKKIRKRECDRLYRENNKEELRLKKKKYRLSEQGKKKACDWQSKMMNKIEFRIKKNLRSRVYVALKRGCKSDNTANLLGCSIDFFKKYFEEKFTDGMSWDKYMQGGIHIDHKIPCKSFDLSKEEEQKKCFHYTNLQPLWDIDNLKKGAKIL